ncbi:carbamoyl-phosphate synthase small subunit [Paucilactobacillus hokkaidonensis JCM 18461]|uniref:Carbamoyl phosphate synthase small chain n=2 Tax=Paucilactobacillus hokkaidonensis TaxID=1193095 RepID=A0A0A1GUC6_9LACO|nr:carbamoyl phosphate synthase small subunit [Paucilactobacillus hokkaidonensis]KRO08826.1 carbamoyl phosphate synthase small subunit [Paucilactobacillus hokkaidonensis]BAP84609.1 carbamoyl-phosphate synthase small subunit [Paucilactobacillus hokkaidonensis JCM 18461]
MKKYITLSDGTTFTGISFGANNQCVAGELVFNTGMTGYQEAITDPSYTGQLITFTYPLIGTYGVNLMQSQATHACCQAIIVHQLENESSHHNYQLSLNKFLADQGIPGISNIDTRMLTKHIRQFGTLKAVITNQPIATQDFEHVYLALHAQIEVSNNTVAFAKNTNHKFHVVLLDFGSKQAIVTQLQAAGCNVTVLPGQTTDLQSIKDCQPDGILLSNGPGNPTEYEANFVLINQLEQLFPLAGICLGHQLIALANGATTYKLPFGHRGLNHPVTLTETNQTIMTSQNHGYAVDKNSLSDTDLSICAIEGNDRTIEGLKHNFLPVISVQYHPEANPGPLDGQNFFTQFTQLMTKGVKQHA